MKHYLLLFLFLLSAGHTQAQDCSQLYFSEYVEGSVGNNKALEISNPSNNAIDLSNYKVDLYSNGSSTATQTETLSGMLMPNSVYVIANSGSDPSILSKADITSSVTFFNGDDALALINTVTNDTIDVIGVRGVDPALMGCR